MASEAHGGSTLPSITFAAPGLSLATRCGGCWRLLLDLKAPLTSVSDVLTDVWTARHFLLEANASGEPPVFFAVACGILGTSACAGSAFALWVHRRALLSVVRDLGLTLPYCFRVSLCAPLFVPTMVLLIFVLLCPVGHFLPVVLWALATWRATPSPPLLEELQEQLRAQAETFDEKVAEVMERTGSSSAALDAGTSAASAELSRQRRQQRFTASSTSGAGSYQQYAEAYRAYVRDTLAANLAPAAPDEPHLEGFAHRALHPPARPPGLEMAERSFEAARVKLQEAQAAADAEWKGESSDGPASQRWKVASEDAVAAKEALLRALRGVGAEKHMQFHALEGLEGFVGRLEELVRQSVAKGHRDAGMAPRVELTRAGAVATKHFPRESCKLIVAGCGVCLDKFGTCLAADSKARLELDEVEASADQVRQAQARAAQARARVLKIRRAQSNKEEPDIASLELRAQYEIAMRVERDAIDDEQSALVAATTRAGNDPLVQDALSEYHHALADRERGERHEAANDLVYRRRVERQQRMKDDHRFAVEVTSKVLAAEFRRAQFEHKVSAEAGFIIESGLESVPQSLLQCSAIAILTRRDRGGVTFASYCSVALSVYAVLTKVYVFCHSADKRVYNLKVAAICFDILTLFYTVTTLWDCPSGTHTGCQRPFFLTREVDLPSVVYIYIYATWCLVSSIATALSIVGLWAYYIISLPSHSWTRRGSGSMNPPKVEGWNPLWRAAEFLFGHELGCFELVVVAVFTLPFVLVVAAFAALFVGILVALAAATMRLSYLVLWLHTMELDLFEGPSKAQYFCAYQYVVGAADADNLFLRLQAAVDVLHDLFDDGSTAGHSMLGASRSAGLHRGAFAACRIAWDLVLAVARALDEAYYSALQHLGGEKLRRRGAGCVIAARLGFVVFALPTMTYSALYVPFTALRAFKFAREEGQMPSFFQIVLLLSANVLGISVLVLLQRTSAGTFLRFVLAVPRPSVAVVLDAVGDQAEVLRRLEAATAVAQPPPSFDTASSEQVAQGHEEALFSASQSFVPGASGYVQMSRFAARSP